MYGFAGTAGACRAMPRTRSINTAIGKYVAHYDGEVALECLLLLAGIDSPGFTDTSLGYPPSGDDQRVSGNPESAPEMSR
jgi:hypothetical protein